MPYKAIFLDLDGTALCDNHQLCPDLLPIIAQLKERDVEVVFSTGRSFASSKQYADAVGGTRYIINYNGAYVFDFHNEQILTQSVLPQKVVEQTQIFAQRFALDPIYFHNDTLYSYDEGLPNDIYEGEQFVQLTAETNWSKKTFTKTLFIAPKEEIFHLRQRAIEFFPNATIVTSADNYLEIMPLNVDKSLGVKAVLQALNLTPADAIAFGNQLNDLAMLKAVDQGFIVENAPPLLKEKIPSTHHLGDNNRAAVARKLDQIFQLNYF